ncbi:hypothetical protein BC828DRAFT_391892 [Blastocladiella britannica]|nr:hypothetical protein BC828DRAFT_391892 [Blastocladiella britannica]
MNQNIFTNDNTYATRRADVSPLYITWLVIQGVLNAVLTRALPLLVTSILLAWNAFLSVAAAVMGMDAMPLRMAADDMVGRTGVTPLALDMRRAGSIPLVVGAAVIAVWIVVVVARAATRVARIVASTLVKVGLGLMVLTVLAGVYAAAANDDDSTSL